jgi:NADH-quinone oxidoreductase subunit H
VVMVYGSLKLTDIGALQDSFFHWGIFMQPLGFILFLTCAIAENKRAPFDVPEAESELVAGYFTEYSGLKFVMFWMGEFLEMVTISGIVATLFFGAWHLPFISDAMLLSFFQGAGPNGAAALAIVVNIATFFAKVIFFIWLQMTIRWTLLRFRYDQVMKLCWKMILPLSLINILITGLVLLKWTK